MGKIDDRLQLQEEKNLQAGEHVVGSASGLSSSGFSSELSSGFSAVSCAGSSPVGSPGPGLGTMSITPVSLLC